MPVNLPDDLSAWEVVRKVEQRFGLIGYARFIKIMELLAASPLSGASRIELMPSDWLEALRCTAADLRQFLTYLQRADWLTFDEPAEHGLPLRVTLLHAGRLQDKAAAVLFDSPEQWAAWWVVEMGMPEQLAVDPQRLQMFARWCAVNVTVAELEQAVTAAANRKASLDPVSLNADLRALREARLQRVRA